MRPSTRRGVPDRDHVRALFREYQKSHETEVREALIEAHLGLVEYLSRRFAGRGEPLEDLIQVATIGLIKAVDRFDPEREVEFSTYATPTIVGELKRHFRDKGWAVRVPRRLQELNLQLGEIMGQLSQKLVAAHAFGFQLQSPRRYAAQALRNAPRPRQLRQVHAFQFRGDLIDGPWQELRIDFCSHFAARPFCLGFTHLELEIMEGSLGQHLFQLQLFDRQLRDAQFAFRIHAADQFTRRGAGRRSSKQGGQKPLQPAWPCSRPNPAIQVGGVQLVGVQMKFPVRAIFSLGSCRFLDIARPRPAKALDFHQARDAPPVDPIQCTFENFQGLVQPCHRQIRFGKANPAIPPAGERLFFWG